jgi:hypothetical protein
MIILKANTVNLFVSSVLFVFWYDSPNVLDTPHICNFSRLRVKFKMQGLKYILKYQILIKLFVLNHLREGRYVCFVYRSSVHSAQCVFFVIYLPEADHNWCPKHVADLHRL